MVRLDRFYAPNLAVDVGVYVLEGAEAHHLLHVLRAKVGDRVELFDGRGTRVSAEVIRAAKREVELAIGRVEVLPAPAPLVVACAMPKGDRATWLVEKCVELGVTRVIPLETSRSVVHPDTGKRAKLERAGIEACKQCGRDHLLGLEPTTNWIDVATTRGGWMLHVDGEDLAAGVAHRPETIAIGPEGGWTDEEVRLAHDAGWRILRLSGYVLRIETAALATVALAQVVADHAETRR